MPDRDALAALDAIDQRVQAATPGPWKIGEGYEEGDARFTGQAVEFRFDEAGDLVVDYEASWSPDVELIASAPTDLARMSAALREALRIIDFNRELNELHGWFGDGLRRSTLTDLRDAISDALGGAQ